MITFDKINVCVSLSLSVDEIDKNKTANIQSNM